MNFKVGQRVVCVSKSAHPESATRVLALGATYTAQDLRYCPTCGTQAINVGFDYNSPVETECINGHSSYCFTGKRWISATRFVPLEEWEQSEEAVNELLQPQSVGEIRE